MVISENRKHHDIRNILSVLGAAVICAVLLASMFIYYYSPSGRYLAGHTLLDPNTIETINGWDQHPKSGKKIHFVFDHIEFSYYDSQKGKIKIHSLPFETYQDFYSMIAEEKSLEEVSKNTQDLFLKSPPSVLSITMRTMEDSKNLTSNVFQVVQFVPEDYFRVQLHENKEGEWAYFYRAGLYSQVMRIFTQQQNYE